MPDNDGFEPRLGRMRAKGAGKARRYLGRVLAAAVLAGGGRRTGGVFDGSRIGRGAARARVAAHGRNGRRAVVKTRLVRLGGKGAAAARAHLRYIQRDGVTREGEPGQLYARDGDRADGPAFLERSAGDRHQFRFIVSAEDGADYEDLKPLVRRLMAQVEADLGTGLDWVAVDHFNTGHPHSHIMLRGVDDRGADLVIARDYIAHGLRARAEQLVTLDLGPRTELEILQQRHREIDAERLTALDRAMLREAGDDHVVRAAGRTGRDQATRAARLNKLAALGLAEEVGAGRWRLDPVLEDRLRRLGERGDIIRTMQRAMSEREGEGHLDDMRIHDPVRDPPIVGRIVERGLADELHDRHYLIVDGIDGRLYHVAIGDGAATEPTPAGHVVRIAARTIEPRAVDREVARIAAAHGGVYSADLHRLERPEASAHFVDAHVRRLEALRRATRAVVRDDEGGRAVWRIADDHLDRAASFERDRAARNPVAVTILADRAPGDCIACDGASWIDRSLTGGEPLAPRDRGFGRELRAAQAARRAWLVAQGLGEESVQGFRAKPDMIATLTRRDVDAAGRGIAAVTGIAFRRVEPGDRVEGIVRRRVDLVSGRFAMIERAQDFALVPWRPVFERRIGAHASGIVRAGDTHWHFGRGRGGPVIS